MVKGNPRKVSFHLLVLQGYTTLVLQGFPNQRPIENIDWCLSAVQMYYKVIQYILYENLNGH